MSTYWQLIGPFGTVGRVFIPLGHLKQPQMGLAGVAAATAARMAKAAKVVFITVVI
jgi:hypothetical protein